MAGESGCKGKRTQSKTYAMFGAMNLLLQLTQFSLMRGLD